MIRSLTVNSLCLSLAILAVVATAADIPNPFPRPILLGETVKRWDFESTTDGWRAAHACQLLAAEGALQVTATGTDPYLVAPCDSPAGQLALRVRLKSNGSGPGQFFWSLRDAGGFSPENQRDFKMAHDGQWHEYQVMIQVDRPLGALRLDPGGEAGRIEVDWIEVRRARRHPIAITALRADEGELVVSIRNHGETPIDAKLNATMSVALPPGKITPAVLPLRISGPLQRVEAIVVAEDLPPVRRASWIYASDSELTGAKLTRGAVTVEVAGDGSLVRVRRAGEIVAFLAPVVHREGRLLPLQVETADQRVRLEGQDVRATLELTSEQELQVRIRSDEPVEGPVVRVVGGLEQGLLSGVEYLGKGELSSSKLDIETPEYLRVEPNPMKLTMPLMACVTDRASVALAWTDTTLRPVFATPNFLDGTPDHRMGLKGKSIDALVRIGPGWPDGGRLEEIILWDVQRRGLPDLPPRPRTRQQQDELSLAAYRNLVFDEVSGGWFHAVVPGVRQSPNRGAHFADHASAIWRLTGSVPEVPSFAHGGAHVRNPASYFVTGRTADWLRIVDRQATAMIAGQQADGSFRYGGKFRRGHFEDTSSGICARPAYELLDHAYYTGNQQSLAAGLKTLAYMKRFRTPRGSQTWEVPLHTPDILASAQLVWAYVRGYQLTGDRQWLDEARRWAVTGLPFVYQWSNQPIMAYATTPVYGATNWQAPNWIGLPVQWCGTVYAYALLLLAEHDDTIDWRKVAEGILICGEQMQYPDGPSIGCLPDVFHLESQRRAPADINPGALVSLRLLIDGQLDSLARVSDRGHVVVAPFPAKIRAGEAVIQARAGVKYQVLIDGRRVVDVVSGGEDVIELE